MSETYTGGCGCGAVRYEATGAPVYQNHCQCRQCQRASGTGHGSYLSFAGSGVVRIEGEVGTWAVIGDSGMSKRYGFCAVCGTPLYVIPDVAPGIIAVAAGSLDDPGRFTPVAVTYAGSALAWDLQDPALAAFERMPLT